MYRIFYTPTKYVQGQGALAKTGELLRPKYTSCFAVLDPSIEGMLRESLEQAFAEKDGTAMPRLTTAPALGECCDEEVARLAALAKEAGAEAIIAAGGGKTVDIGKAVANATNAACVIIPTIAASDAPTSSIAIMYTNDHVYKGAVRFDDNPYMILVDTDVIAAAPPRFLAAGMGDALATKIEAQHCMNAGGNNLHGFTGTESALQLARYAYDVILKHGEEAMKDNAQKRVTPAFESVIEANILMSGVGWENCGLAIPHAFHGSLTGITRFDKAMHGERVALGILIQLHYDGESEELARLTDFFKKVGLPTSFNDISSNGAVTDEELTTAATFIARPGSYAHNTPGGLNMEKLMASMKHFA